MDGRGRVVDLAFAEGTSEFMAHEGALRSLVFPLQSPSDDGVRLATRIVVNCDGTECYAQLGPPRYHR